MPGDCGHLRAMRLLPFAAAADEARLTLSGPARKFVEGRDHAAKAWGWVLSWASIWRSRSLRSVRVNFQVNGRAMVL
jgi:hypothetical protein